MLINFEADESWDWLNEWPWRIVSLIMLHWWNEVVFLEVFHSAKRILILSWSVYIQALTQIWHLQIVRFLFNRQLFSLNVLKKSPECSRFGFIKTLLLQTKQGTSPWLHFCLIDWLCLDCSLSRWIRQSLQFGLSQPFIHFIKNRVN